MEIGRSCEGASILRPKRLVLSQLTYQQSLLIVWLRKVSIAHNFQIIIMQPSIIIQEQVAVLPLHPVWHMNMMSINDSDFVDKPTHTDVLLGRGVGTNRHSGNTNFRDIVSQRISAYATSTKSKKVEITRSVVDHIHTKLNPPGRFLEKDPETGRWKEVDMKRAHEKTAQALRDGAAPLRKKLSSEIIGNHDFLADVFNKDNVKRAPKKARKSAAKNTSKKTRACVVSNEAAIESPKQKEVDLHMSSRLPSPIFSGSSIDQWLCVPPDFSLITPTQSPVPQSQADEFGMPFYLIQCKEDSDMVDIRDEEIYRLWISCWQSYSHSEYAKWKWKQYKACVAIMQ